MNHAAPVHVFHRLHKLSEQEPTGIFAHGSAALAEIEHESALDILKSNVNQVGQHAARTLQDLPITTIVNESDDVLVVQCAEDLYLLLYKLRVRVVVAFEELVPQNLQCYFFGWISQVSSEVDLGGIAVS